MTSSSARWPASRLPRASCHVSRSRSISLAELWTTATTTLNPHRTVNIGIVCYASVGGSGVVATELATALADRGHQVHLISSEPPFRLARLQAGLTFHQVEDADLPALSRAAVPAVAGQQDRAGGARAALRYRPRALRDPARDGGATSSNAGLESGGHAAPTVVTTLHGTDITLVGSDPSYTEIVAYSIEQSDGVTAVSESLQGGHVTVRSASRATSRSSRTSSIARYVRPAPGPGLRQRFCCRMRIAALVIHVSNFRPVKRVDAVDARSSVASARGACQARCSSATGRTSRWTATGSSNASSAWVPP